MSFSRMPLESQHIKRLGKSLREYSEVCIESLED
jgi:hypothetical protein